MKRAVSLVSGLLLSTLANSSEKKISISKKVLQNAGLSFISHTGPGRFDSYLSLEVNFAPVAEVFKNLLIEKKRSMTSRGEAHITVVTPIEYFDVLAKHLSMAEIDELALKHGLQASSFKVKCLGVGALDIDGKREETYFLVVESKALFKIREEIKKTFVAKGGDGAQFDSAHFYPHITVGFTKRDLHESDGVIKNENACVSPIQLK